MSNDVLDEDVEQVPHMAALIFDAIERKEMALKPRVKVKAQGRAVSIPNARVKDGKLEVDGPRKKLPPHVKYAMDKKTKIKRGKRV